MLVLLISLVSVSLVVVIDVWVRFVVVNIEGKLFLFVRCMVVRILGLLLRVFYIVVSMVCEGERDVMVIFGMKG